MYSKPINLVNSCHFNSAEVNSTPKKTFDCGSKDCPHSTAYENKE